MLCVSNLKFGKYLGDIQNLPGIPPAYQGRKGIIGIYSTGLLNKIVQRTRSGNFGYMEKLGNFLLHSLAFTFYIGPNKVGAVE